MVGLAAACLGLLISRISPGDFGDTIREVSWKTAAAGFAAALVCYSLKALRYRILLGRRARFARVFGVTVAQNVIAQLVPARAGDVGYVVLVKKAGLGSYGYGLASLLVCRFVDLVILWVMYVTSLSALGLDQPILRWVGIVIGGGLAVAILVIAAVIFKRERAAGAVEWVLRRLRLLNRGFVNRAWDELKKAAAQAERAWSWRTLAGVGAVSIGVWAASSLWNYLVWHAVGATLTIPQVVFMTSFSYLLSLLPIFVLGGVGTADAVHAGVLVAFGRGGSPAAVFSLFNRVLTTIYQVLFGLMLVPLLRRSKGRSGE